MIVTMPIGRGKTTKEDNSQVTQLPQAARKRPISVVMVSYMTGPALMEAITAVLADRDIHELIVVDNGNTESARARLSQLTAKRTRVRFLQGHGNIGYSGSSVYSPRDRPTSNTSRSDRYDFRGLFDDGSSKL